MPPKPKLTVVIPAYNELYRLPAFLLDVRKYLEAKFPDCYEILVVDDGSRDATAQVVKKILGPDSVIRLEQNQGKGAAVRAGMLKARGELVLFADADGATPIAEEARLRAAIAAGADVAIGSRAKGGKNHLLLLGTSRPPNDRADGFPEVERQVLPHRLLVGRVFAGLVNVLLNLGVRDTQCGFKLFRANVVHDLFSELETPRFGFDVEILVRARELGYRIEEVGVSWNEKDGSKVSVVRDSVRMFFEILAIRKSLRQRARNRPAVKNDTRAAS